MPRTIFITGASSGTGLASARLFYSKGWNVIATMRKPESCTELRDLESDRLLLLWVDVTDLSSIRSAVTAGISTFGRIDVLLNNAGYGGSGAIQRQSLWYEKKTRDP